MAAQETNEFDFETQEGGIEVELASSLEFDITTEEDGILVNIGGISGEIRRRAQIF